MWRLQGQRFVRYADDMVIFCKSKASAEQALEHIIPYIEGKLFLKVNREKTEVSYAGKIKFLGYGFYKSRKVFQPRVHQRSKEKLKTKVKELIGRRFIPSYEDWKRKLKRFVIGWVNYYKFADMDGFLKDIDEWMLRRIRMVFWKRWKRVRTRYRNLEKLGISHSNAGILANSRKGYWRIASSTILHAALSNRILEKAISPLITILSRRKLRNRRVPTSTHGGMRGRLGK